MLATRGTLPRQIVDDSSRRLRKTLEVHRDYGDHVRSGSGTLRDLKREELKANIAIGVCSFIFFCVAAYVAHKRIATSNTATFIVRPAVQTVALPFRILRAIARAFRSCFPARKVLHSDRRTGGLEASASHLETRGHPAVKETLENGQPVGRAGLEHPPVTEAILQTQGLGGADEL
jgi:hypothetical protein